MESQLIGRKVSFCLLLCGCAGPVYVPQPLEIINHRQYIIDALFCQKAAAAYRSRLDVSSVAYDAISGGAKDASGAAINPLVPVLGAAGGATSALADGLGVLGRARQQVAKHCLIERTRRDESAIEADPD